MLVALLAVGYSVEEIAETLEGDTIKRVIKGNATIEMNLL